MDKAARAALLTAKGTNKKLLHQDGPLSIYKQYNDTYIAEHNGQRVGEMNLSSRAPYATRVEVHPDFRRMGIASKLYDVAESDIGRKMMPSPLGLSDDATKMWKKRLNNYDDMGQRADIVREAVNVGRAAGVGKSAANRMMPFGYDPETEKVKGYSTGGALELARARTAVTRAGGQIAPSKYLPNVPRQVHAGGGRVGYEDGGDVGGTEPKNTVKAYKLFKRKKDGNIYPLFVNANKPVPIGQWLDAEEGPQGKSEGKVKSSLGDLAYRPGWHAGDLPVATHIGGKSKKELTAPDYRPDDHVWAEVEMPNDVDWQSVANSRMRRTADGRPILNTAHITDQLPKGGFYRYKTNPNMTGNWLIGGSMKVNRILHDDEVKQINDAAGTADLPRMPDITKAEGGAALALTRRFTKDGAGATMALKPKGK